MSNELSINSYFHKEISGIYLGCYHMFEPYSQIGTSITKILNDLFLIAYVYKHYERFKKYLYAFIYSKSNKFTKILRV